MAFLAVRYGKMAGSVRDFLETLNKIYWANPNY